MGRRRNGPPAEEENEANFSFAQHPGLDGGRGPGFCPGVHFRREGSSLDLVQRSLVRVYQRTLLTKKRRPPALWNLALTIFIRRREERNGAAVLGEENGT